MPFKKIREAFQGSLGRLKTPEKPPTAEIRYEQVWREHPVIAIGDLHGNHDALAENGIFADVFERDAEGTLHWKGGDTRLVILGDVLADRHAEGLRILRDVARLRDEARAAGGELVLLAGNHDDLALRFLCNQGIERSSSEDVSMHMIGSRSFFGITEFLSEDLREQVKGVSSKGAFAYATIMHDLFKSPILEQVRTQFMNSGEMHALVAQFQVLHVIDDTLFTHCDAGDTMLNFFLSYAQQHHLNPQDAAHAINTHYQDGLLALLQTPDDPKKQKIIHEFWHISSLFLDTHNRTRSMTASLIADLRNMGINAIIHGHSYRAEDGHPDLKLESWGTEFTMVSADFNSFQDNKPIKDEMHRSVAFVGKNGEITVDQNKRVIRAKR